jgi:hypothetical protein
MNVPGYLRQTSSLNGLLLLFGTLFVLSQATIVWILGPVRHDLLALQTTFSQAGFTATVGQWGPAEVECFRKHFHFDIVHPVWYALFFAAVLAKLFNLQDIPKRYDIFIWMPLAAGFCDFAENSIHAPFAGQIGSMPQPYIALAASFATAKWSLVFLFCLAIVVLLVRRFFLSRTSTDL